MMTVKEMLARFARRHDDWGLYRKGGPANRHRRITDALARCFVLDTDRIQYDRKMIVSCRSLIPYMEPVADPDSKWWPSEYRRKYPTCVTPVKKVTRKEALKRIAEGNLGIDDKLGIWNGSFWHGLKLSGTLRRGVGTEFRIWERLHEELVADLSEMPLMKRLEAKAAKHGQRRLRRCYVALLPPENPMGASTLAGLFAGAALREDAGGTWMELPDGDAIKAILGDWGIPFRPAEYPKDRKVVRVSPLFGALASSLMPPRSADRFRSIRNAGGCPYLSAVLWEMAVARKNSRYMPFPDALPFGCSKATFFRRGWHRRDLHKAGWLALGIRITPKLRGLMVGFFQRRTCERNGHAYDPETFPMSPDVGIPPLSFPMSPDVGIPPPSSPPPSSLG